jgi:O-acetyl-ADP-ribose deacetylase (regulator of RNase III)
MQASLNNISIHIVQTDLTAQAVDAIVTSATTTFDMSFGIGQKVLAKAGIPIQQELATYIPAEEGQVFASTAGKLPAQFVIHAVGPRMGSGNERGKLVSAVWNALHLAEEKELTSIAFPPISTGALGYPVEACASIMALKIVDFTFEEVQHLKTIMVCLETDEEHRIFTHAFEKEIEEARADLD